MYRYKAIFSLLFFASFVFAQKPVGFKSLYDSVKKYESLDWDLSYLYAKMAFEAGGKSIDYHNVITLNNTLDTYYQKRNMLDSSFNVDKRSLQIAKDNKDTSLIAYGLNNLAVVYSLAGNYQSSIDMYKKALEMLTKLKDYKQIANTNYNLSIPFSALDMNDSAIFYTNIAFENYKKVKDYSGLASCYNSYGSEEDRKGNYAEAIKFYELEIVNFKLAKEPASLIVPYQNMADTYLKMRNFKGSKEYLEISTALATSLGSNTDLYDIYCIYSDYYEALGDYKKANEYLRKHYKGKETMMSDELKTELSDQKSRFDRENSESTITIHKLEAEKNLKSREAIKWVLISSSFFFIIVIVLYINRYRIKQRSYLKLNEYKNQLVRQKEKIEESQKEIIDSINYAKRIQTAIMALEEDVLKYFPESFIIYKPKNIVAGDFYFFEVTDKYVFYAAADCTGHGVPGALLSVVCANALSRCVKEFNLTYPGKILDKTRELVLETFRKSGKEVKDGMDISLCRFEITNLKSGLSPVNILWAGANNSLWYIKDKQLQEIKADKQPIGYIEQSKPFTTHALDLEKGTEVYFFTDGYVDQFGGEKGKKLKFRQLKERMLSIYTLPMHEQKNNLDRFFNDWKGDLEQVDDVLVLGIKI